MEHGEEPGDRRRGWRDDYPRTSDPEEFGRRATPKCAAILELWQARRGSRPMPARRDFDPIDLKRWMGWLTLTDVLSADPLRLRYRLVGTGHVALRGFDPTGRTVEEGYFGRGMQEVLRNYRIVIDRRTFVYDWDARQAPSGRLVESEALLMPLSSDGERVDMVMIYAEGADRPD